MSEYNLTDRTDGQLVVGVCTDTIEHPDWTGEVRDGNDIAIVKLCKPIIYSEVSARDKQILLSSKRLHDVSCKLLVISKVTMPIHNDSLHINV